jgi:hypothetical protein
VFTVSTYWLFPTDPLLSEGVSPFVPTPRKLKPVTGAAKALPSGAGCTTGSGRSERIFRKSGSSGFSGPSSSTACWTRSVFAMSRRGAETSKCEAETA